MQLPNAIRKRLVTMRSEVQLLTKFGVCIDNTGYPASLEARKLYPVIPDEEAAKHGYVRVIDESGEDYWHSAERFFMPGAKRPQRTS